MVWYDHGIKFAVIVAISVTVMILQKRSLSYRGMNLISTVLVVSTIYRLFIGHIGYL